MKWKTAQNRGWIKWAKSLDLRPDDADDSGGSRMVYVFKDFVIKIQYDFANDTNWREWEVWRRLKDTKYADDLAPVLAYDEATTMLVMARCQTHFEDREYGVLDWEEWGPVSGRLEAIGISDAIGPNFGMFEGRIVQLDYAWLSGQYNEDSPISELVSDYGDDDYCWCSACR